MAGCVLLGGWCVEARSVGEAALRAAVTSTVLYCSRRRGDDVLVKRLYYGLV